MKNIDYIIKNNRERIDFWYLYPIIIHLFTLIGLFFAIIFITKPMFFKLFFIGISYFLLILAVFFHLKNLLHRTTYNIYINNSKQSTESIIAEISIDFSLKIKKTDENIYTMTYFMPSKYYLFKREKKVTIITINNIILLNIAFSDKSVLLSFKDNQAIKIINAIERKVESDEVRGNFKIINPFNGYIKN